VSLLSPFSLVVGVLTLALAAQQGSAWLVLKTEGDLAQRARRTQMGAQIVVVVAWLAATALAFAGSLPAIDNFKTNLAAWIGPVLVVNAIFFGFRATLIGQQFRAFVCSSLTIAFLAITAATALYPNLVPAVVPARSLTVDNAHSSDLTMQVMLVVAVVGMPIVLALHVLHLLEVQGQGPPGQRQLLRQGGAAPAARAGAAPAARAAPQHGEGGTPLAQFLNTHGPE